MPFQRTRNCLDQFISNYLYFGKSKSGMKRDSWIDSKGNERKRCSLFDAAALKSSIRRRCHQSSEKVSLCAFFCKRASLAVETALVLPLFFLGLVTMISLMDIYKVQTQHLHALCEKAKEAGMYGCIPGGRGPKEITLPDIYSYTPVGGLVPSVKLRIYNRVKIHTWTGKTQEGRLQDGKQEEEMVYVAETGTVYHRNPGCRYLLVSLDQLPGSAIEAARNSRGEKYYPCESCSRNQKPAGMVYVTRGGNRYHNQEACSRLKRTIRLVKLSEVQGMRACSLCG